MDLPPTPFVVSKSNPLRHYTWGKNCEAWTLVDKEALTVKLEKMPPDTEEQLHFHNHAQQFFYIIRGRAVFETDEVITIVHAGEGINIEAGTRHRIVNKEQEMLEFIVCTQPSANNDRQNLV